MDAYSKEQMTKDIPAVEIEGVTVGPMDDCYNNAYFRVTEIDTEGYKSYLGAVEDAGFRKCYSNEKGLYDNFFVSLFRKDERLLSILFITSIRKMFVCIRTEPYAVEWNAQELFQQVPAMDAPKFAFANAVDYGAGNYVITVDETEKEEYQNYLHKLEKAGFIKYVDNGAGLSGTVFSATYTKGNLVVTVTYAIRAKRTFISACFDLPLSEHLRYKEEYTRQNQVGAQTKLHMLELWAYGNSFIWQLKNGHFVICDGGTWHETGYLLDYLEQLTPEGEKPVIEAWFVSHGHCDHCGVFKTFSDNPKEADRIYVEGIYYSEPDERVITLEITGSGFLTAMKEGIKNLRTTKGECPKVYRPQTGQRYYFSDITVDIVLGQEQLPFERYSGDFNDSSTWCMFTVEGQKCLFGGDGDKGGFGVIMEMYDREYLDATIFTLLHHGHNTRALITDYCTVGTVLVTNGRALPGYREKDNAHLKEVSKEWISWADGSKVLSFPYAVGTYENVPPFEWIYHKDKDRP